MNTYKLAVCSLVVACAAAWAAGAADSGVVKGSIKFAGEAPKMKKLKMDADPKCAEMHADEPARSEEVVVNSNGTLRWVLVSVKSGLGDKTYEAPKEPVTITQVGCHYVPHVFGMMAKQPLKIVNSDETLHNIHAMPDAATGNKEFNIGQPNKGMETTRTFANPEVAVKFKCDVHPWMGAYVGVFSHPFFAVSGEDGSFEIKGLPAGEYEIAAWHEKFGEQTQKVKVGAGETKEVTFTFKAAE